MRNLRTICLTVVLLAPLFVPGDDAYAKAWRDPFWPVGYIPESARPKPEPVVEAPKPESGPRMIELPKPVVDWKEARRRLKVSAYAEANDIRSCFVNGHLVSEGETVSLINQGVRYGWRVIRVDPDPANTVFEELEARLVKGGKAVVQP